MSTQIFPSTAQCPGIDISINRQVDWGDVIVQESVSGQEVRVARRIFPRRTFELKFNFLRSSTLAVGQPSVLELQAFEGFFNNRQGMFDSFLWSDPDDSVTSSSQLIGVGDGMTQNFQLQRGLGGFFEPVLAPILTSSTTTIVYKSDWQGKQQQYTFPRTNMVPWSQAISSAPPESGFWNFTFISSHSTNNTAPDGTLTATKLTLASSTSAFSQLVFNSNQGQINLSSGVIYTQSGFMKVPAGSGPQWTQLIVQDGSTPFNSVRCFFDLLNGVVGGSFPNPSSNSAINRILGGSISKVGEGFYRCSMTFTFITSTTPSIYFASAGGNFNGGASTNGGILTVWGMQLEASTFPTSYFPSSGTRATVTADIASITGWGSTSPGLVTFNTPPAVGSFLSADIAYNQPVRFADDTMTFDRFVILIYENKKVNFESII